MTNSIILRWSFSKGIINWDKIIAKLHDSKFCSIGIKVYFLTMTISRLEYLRIHSKWFSAEFKKYIQTAYMWIHILPCDIPLMKIKDVSIFQHPNTSQRHYGNTIVLHLLDHNIHHTNGQIQHVKRKCNMHYIHKNIIDWMNMEKDKSNPLLEHIWIMVELWIQRSTDCFKWNIYISMKNNNETLKYLHKLQLNWNGRWSKS